MLFVCRVALFCGILRFDPPLPQTMTHITVGFQPARDLVKGDNVTVNLKVRKSRTAFQSVSRTSDGAMCADYGS